MCRMHSRDGAGGSDRRRGPRCQSPERLAFEHHYREALETIWAVVDPVALCESEDNVVHKVADGIACLELAYHNE
jgi:hypothetical protein